MKFRYKKYAPGFLRPVIPIEVIYKKIAIPYEVLVDSGADFSVFDAGIAEILDINLEEGEEQEVAGITGASAPIYFHWVNLKVGRRQFKQRVAFLKEMGQFGYGVVGQHGFFDIFVVKFDLVKQEVELRERRK